MGTSWPTSRRAAIVAALAGFAIALRRAPFRARWHAFLLRLPVVGRLLRSLDTARFAEHFGAHCGAGRHEQSK